jgi:hypothetical protein
MVTDAAADRREGIYLEQNVQSALVVTPAQSLNIFAGVGVNRACCGTCGHIAR